MPLSGRIVEQQKSLYRVDTGECEMTAGLRGLLKRDREKPCVGDMVTLEGAGDPDAVAVITSVAARRNRLLRPVIANVDQALLMVSLREPAIERDTIDRFLVHMHHLDIPVGLLFNKVDVLEPDELELLQQDMQVYSSAGYPCVALSALTQPIPEQLRELCEGKVSALAGASGVGKSTLINALLPTLGQATAKVSRKTERGVHTTTTTSLLKLSANTYLADTPGFVALGLPRIDERDLQLHFPELEAYVGRCRFNNCQHLEEPGCEVREALANGAIDADRYASYVRFHAELAARPHGSR
jgi:ribosome biogenesis GTPase / thiamine phosphate phosphatase